MKVIIVDDEWLAIKQFEMEVEELEGVELVASFCNPNDALEFLKKNPVETVLLDIEMPEMNGLVLAKKIRAIYPDIVIIFITGYEDYALDAFKIKADYYLMKPYNKEDIREVTDRARLLSRRQQKRVYFRTFGRFDLFIDGYVVNLSNAKAKELLALCVDHRGGNVTIEEAIDKLWGERVYDEKVKNLYRKAIMYLKNVFKEYNVESVFTSNRGTCNINCMEVECDYYNLLEKREKNYEAAIGYYMEEYSWAEETAVQIEERLMN